MINTINKYIESELISPANSMLLHSDDDLLGAGMLTSMHFMRLINFIESNYEISVPPEEMIIENFQSTGRIVSYLAEQHKIV